MMKIPADAICMPLGISLASAHRVTTSNGRTAMVDSKQLQELLLQSLEHERGGVQVYEAAVSCAISEDLKKEWSEYLEQTRKNVQILEGVFRKFELNTEQESPGREIVRDLGASLVAAMQKAKAAGIPEAAQLVACECVVLAETKDHADWELLTKCAESLTGPQKEALKEATDIVEEEEDEHLYHSKGYCRELWLDSLGLPAVLPPPEEEKHVTTAIGAARAQQDSERTR
jgi:rubrerythrin